MVKERKMGVVIWDYVSLIFPLLYLQEQIMNITR